MKKIHLLLLMIFIVVTSTYSQTTETFETEMSGSTTFTDNGQTFNITSQAGGPFSIIDPGADFGWSGTATDRQSIDNSLSATFGTPAGFTISSNKVFILKSFYLYLARENLTSGTGTFTITGKKSGTTVFTATASSGFTDPMSATNNGYTLINLSNYGGANNASIAIDQFVMSTTGTFEYLSLDAMKWQTILAPTVTTTSATSIGAAKATMGGNATADGGAIISERGIVWATTTAPTIANSKATNGSGTGNFSGVVSSFPAETKIYYRAYATNAVGTNYGTELDFTTKPSLTATQSQNNLFCNLGTNGTATVTPSGGVAPYIYDWSPNGGTAATASGLVANNYSCKITDNEGTIITKNFTITQPTVISGTTVVSNVSCFGGTNGTINLTPTGGTPGYTFNWGGGITTEDRTGLSAGTYTCTITDANLCTKTESVVITQPAAITSSVASQTNVSCNGENNGSATITAGGGTPGYTYSWLPSGGTAATATRLTAGTYTCTITDANLCTKTQFFVITQPAAITLSVASQTNVSCFGGSNGAASINNPTSRAGGGGYSYNWTPGNPTGDGTTSVTGLTAGTWTCTVTDGNFCTKDQIFIITEPTALTSGIVAQTNVFCNGENNGSATVDTDGGAGSYTYSWSPSGGTAATATGLTAGTYTCTITDANQCTKTQSVTITQPTVLPNNVTTISNCDSYTWTNNGQTYATSGNYIGTTTNCVTEELNLTINTTPVISGNATQNFNVTDTIASIIVNPTNVVWYANLAAANAGTSPLLATQVLANNTTYYAVTTGTCPSVPFAVLVGTTLSNNSFNNQLNIELYPNPSTGIFNLKLPTVLQIEVYNNLGQLLSSEKMFSGSNVINIADKPAGIYFLKANDGNNVSTFKIIKN